MRSRDRRAVAIAVVVAVVGGAIGVSGGGAVSETAEAVELAPTREPPGLVATGRRGAGLASRESGLPVTTGAGDPAEAAEPIDLDAPIVDEVTWGLRSTWELRDGRDGRPLTRRDVGPGVLGWFIESSGGSRYFFALLPTYQAFDVEEFPAVAVDARHPRGATRVRFVWPMYRTFSLDVRVVADDGAPVVGATVERAGPGTTWRQSQATTDADGIARLERLLVLPDARVWVEVVRIADPLAGRAPVRYRVPVEVGDVEAGTPLVVRLAEPWIVPSATPAPTDASGPTHAIGTVRVRVLLADGRPAGNVAVGIDGGGASVFSCRSCTSGAGWRTDADGRASLSAVAGEPVRVSLMDHDHTPTTVVTTVAAGEAVDVTLVEPRPAALDVEVVDAGGAPVPFARLAIRTPSEVPPWDLVDGVVRIDPFTDADGRRSYTRVEPATVEIEATSGGRRGLATVALTAGGRSAVRVRLAPSSPTFPAGSVPPWRR